ncbi:MAG TPA: hypothetical protein EYP71_01700 [Dehalococcoidia bacterium]|nr:hypothetical protein [Dehalococcoidia bacterium]
MWWTILIVFVSIVVLAALSVAVTNALFAWRTNREAERLFKKQSVAGQRVVTEEDLVVLPEPMQRYLRYTGVIGKSRIDVVKVKQEGDIRQAPGQRWMSFEAEQYFAVGSPAFIWQARIKAFPLFSIRARDKYVDGKGNMHIKLPPFLTISDVRGREIDQGSLLRYLAEMVWFPSAYLSSYIRWDAIDADSCKMIAEHQGMTVSAILNFSKEGEIINLIAMRYREISGHYYLEEWSPSMLKYRELNGVKVPTQIEVVWKLSSGDFPCIRIKVADIEYDNFPIPGALGGA